MTTGYIACEGATQTISGSAVAGIAELKLRATYEADRDAPRDHQLILCLKQDAGARKGCDTIAERGFIMTWKDKAELGIKDDAGLRKDNLPPNQVRGPEVPAGPGRSPVIPAASEDKPEIVQTVPQPEDEKATDKSEKK